MVADPQDDAPLAGCALPEELDRTSGQGLTASALGTSDEELDEEIARFQRELQAKRSKAARRS